MKQKFLIILMMAVGLVACALDDEAGTKWEPKTETWTVTIEPEYVMGHSWWGAYSGIGVQMVGANEEGKRVGAFYLGEIKGFTFEEGYRYKLRIEATTTDPRMMDVQMVLMLTPDPASSRGFYFLSGKSVDGGETLDMGIKEIYGAKYEMFRKYDETAEDIHRYICRMRLSITPSEEPVYAGHNYRIRLEELISQREIADDSCAVATSKEEFESKEKALYY